MTVAMTDIAEVTHRVPLSEALAQADVVAREYDTPEEQAAQEEWMRRAIASEVLALHTLQQADS